MNYAGLNDTIINKVLAALKLINNPEIDPDVRQLNQEILFKEVGASVYAKVYDMNAFDYEIEHTTGPGIDDRYYGLAKVAAASSCRCGWIAALSPQLPRYYGEQGPAGR